MISSGIVSGKVFIPILVFCIVVNSSGGSEQTTSGTSKSRQSRTMKELNMQNLPSCLSMFMCRMEGMKKSTPEGDNSKNQDLLMKLLESLMEGENNGENVSSEETNEPYQDDGPPESYEILKHANDNDYNSIYHNSNDNPVPYAEYRMGYRKGKLFGIFNPFSKRNRTATLKTRTKLDKILATQSHRDLQEMRTALSNPPKGRSSSPCSSRKSRLLRITLIRNRHPITPSTSTASPIGPGSGVGSSPPSPQNCPYDFSELQSMLFGAFNNILMTGGALGGQFLMQQGMQSPPKQEMPMTQNGGGLGIETLMGQNGQKLPYTVYANIKLPLTISTDESEMKEKVAKLQAQQYSQMFGSNSKIPGVAAAAVGEKIRYSDFVRRKGTNQKHRKVSSNEKIRHTNVDKDFNQNEYVESGEKSDENSKAFEEVATKLWKQDNFLRMERLKHQHLAPKPPFTRIASDFQHYLKSLQNAFAHFQTNLFSKFQYPRFKMIAKRHLYLLPSVRGKKANEDWHRFPKIYLTSGEQLSSSGEYDSSTEN